MVVFSDRAAIAIPLDNNFNKEVLLDSIDRLDRAFLGGGSNLIEGFQLLNAAVRSLNSSFFQVGDELM